MYHTPGGDRILLDAERRLFTQSLAMIVDLLEEQAEYPNILTAALVVTDQKGEVVLEFPFSEALTSSDETPTTRH